MNQYTEYFPQGSFRGPPQPRILVNNKNRQRLRKPEQTKQQVFSFFISNIFRLFSTCCLFTYTYTKTETAYFQILYRLLHYQMETLSQVSKPRAPPVLSKRKLLMPVIISSYASTNIQGKTCILDIKRS